MNKISTYQPPMFLPPQWTIENWGDGARYLNHDDGLIVIVSDGTYSDGKRWRHFSMSAQGGVPTWEQLRKGKELFLGLESKAISVIPPKSEYVNLNSRGLHLFVCLEGNVLPDFTKGGGTL